MTIVTSTPELEARLANLNAEQRQAVDTLDGPVLVVAGPGTGKTELLSLRVARILLERDVMPKNVLCLTFTEAGTQAMQNRLADLIGAAAYEVKISTFHAFASGLSSSYPQYFSRPATATALSQLQADELVNSLLSSLSPDDPLYQRPFNGVVATLGGISSFISNFKRSGLMPDELKDILMQNEQSFDYIEQDQALAELIATRIPNAADKKAAFVEQITDRISELYQQAPRHLTERLTTVSGVYTPYLSYFKTAFDETELFDPYSNKATGYSQLRDKLFTKDSTGNSVLKARQANVKLASALNVYESYQQTLTDENRYDFDDMILDAINAIEANPEFKYQLQDNYRYLLVDEFQDTNGAQMRILEQLSDYSRTPNILVVGDDDQAIMRFQGASVRHLQQFEQRFENMTRIMLKTNYRSLPSIVELGQELAALIENRLPASATEKHLISSKTESLLQNFTLKQYANRDIQYYELARDIRARIDAGQISRSSKPETAIAVIASRHDSLLKLIPQLNAHDIAFNYRITSSVDEIEPLQTLFTCMRFAVDLARGYKTHAASHLPAILAAPEFGLTPAQYINFALNTRATRRNWLDAMRDSDSPKINSIYDWLLEMTQRSVTAPLRKMVLDLAWPLRRYYAQNDDQNNGDKTSGLRPSGSSTQGEPDISCSEQPDFSRVAQNTSETMGETTEVMRSFGLTTSEPVNGLTTNEPTDDINTSEPTNDTTEFTHPMPDSMAVIEFNYGLSALLDFCESELANAQSSSSAQKPLRLNDLVTLLDDTIRFKQKINVDFAMSRPDAINLITAHGSKGLEYDLVYLIDVSDSQWHGGGGSNTTIIPDNLLFGQDKDDDDARRLLFVAATRAKNELQFTIGTPDPVRELIGLTETIQVEHDFETLVKQSDISLNSRFYPHEFEWATFVRPHLEGLQMSASLLNQFLQVGSKTAQAEDFFAQSILRLPSEPALALEFGDLVHRFFQDWLNLVVRAKSLTQDELFERYAVAIDWMDFEAAERQNMQYRLLQIFEQFLPLAEGIVTPDAIAEQWGNAWFEGVPLTGKFDLLVPDASAKTLEVYDFKTSRSDGRNKLDADQWRQLKFYKLLLEQSAAYQGWTVVGAVDLFVDPTNIASGEVSVPPPISMVDLDLSEFKLLVKAVWQRIASGELDVSGFESSEQLAALKASSVYKSNSAGGRIGDPKPVSAAQIAEAFEQWLIG